MVNSLYTAGYEYPFRIKSLLVAEYTILYIKQACCKSCDIFITEFIVYPVCFGHGKKILKIAGQS